ncbi:unnamed protein product [Blepharisma stoltei]|uniref:Uncharacterized protein n=1 Tax=Blepharisma stoltei TaxID=1481888 RepID=A0AAU9J6L0_9CILI|nr:unnamed protein product [Blepharisma stoltei]
MSRTILDTEPGYWENAFKLWHTSYKDSKFRSGLIHRSHLWGEVDSHDLKYVTSAPSTKRQEARLYAPPRGIPYPRECAKQINKLVQCKASYGVHSPADDVPQCNQWKGVIFEECPHWVVENLALKKKVAKRYEDIDNLTYQRAMEISDYNK